MSSGQSDPRVYYDQKTLDCVNEFESKWQDDLSDCNYLDGIIHAIEYIEKNLDKFGLRRI